MMADYLDGMLCDQVLAGQAAFERAVSRTIQSWRDYTARRIRTIRKETAVARAELAHAWRKPRESAAGKPHFGHDCDRPCIAPWEKDEPCVRATTPFGCGLRWSAFGRAGVCMFCWATDQHLEWSHSRSPRFNWPRGVQDPKIFVDDWTADAAGAASHDGCWRYEMRPPLCWMHIQQHIESELGEQVIGYFCEIRRAREELDNLVEDLELRATKKVTQHLLTEIRQCGSKS